MQYDFLYTQVQNTLVLPEKIQQEVLLHFEKLSEKQIHILQQLIQAENDILLDFLKKQKELWSIPPSDVKSEYMAYRKQKRNSLEAEEKQKEEAELEYLLETLS